MNFFTIKISHAELKKALAKGWVLLRQNRAWKKWRVKRKNPRVRDIALEEQSWRTGSVSQNTVESLANSDM